MSNSYNTFFHPWHSLSIGKDAPHIVTSIIEIQRGSKAKYELDKETGFLKLDRVLASTLTYPFHYGFIPQTYCPDNDPLDIIIICSEQLVPLSMVDARVVGVVQMLDQNERDDKIIAVAAHDPFLKHINELDDIPQEQLHAIKDFFETYKLHEQKKVHVEQLSDRHAAYKIISLAISLYARTFGTTK